MKDNSADNNNESQISEDSQIDNLS